MSNIPDFPLEDRSNNASISSSAKVPATEEIIVSFDEKEVVLETDQGMLTIKGQELHVKRLTLEKGELDLEGLMEGLSYAESRTLSKQGESLFNRLFK